MKRTLCLYRIAVLGAVGVVCSATTTRAEDPVAVTQRLARVQSINGIDDASLTAWHLKLSFQLMDAKGHPSEQGTIEEWWKSPSTYKVVFSSPSYSSSEIHSGDALYRTKDASSAPYLLELVLQQIVRPLTEEDLWSGAPYLQKQDFGKVPLDCIMMTQPIKNLPYPPLGLFPTYCLDHDKDVLRASFNFGNQTVLRNDIGVFQKRLLPTNLIVQSDTKVAITAHVEELRGAVLQESDFAATNVEKLDTNPPRIPSGVMAGHIVSQARPIYPERAKANHATGTVRLNAIIGTDGRIRSLKFIAIPDADLGIAAVDAVRQWRYQPYLLNGAPVEVQTEITVNFEMR